MTAINEFRETYINVLMEGGVVDPDSMFREQFDALDLIDLESEWQGIAPGPEGDEHRAEMLERDIDDVLATVGARVEYSGNKPEKISFFLARMTA
jgi:hypothetical protein